MEESEDFDSVDETHPMPSRREVRNLETIGRYEIQRKIGMGGFGVVYLARDELLQRTVALKVINRGAVDKTEEGLMEEGRTLAQLDHPGIVTVHDIGKDQGRIYFVSTFVEGRTLRQFIKDECPTPDEAAELITEIAEALGYAHRRSVVHRDIKPTNIIITPEGRPIVIDFGVALAASRPRGEHTRRSILGTPSYMSPEQARGESHLVDGRSDIYSLGVILYEMLTRVRPFEGRTEDLIEKVASPTLEARPPRQIDSEIPKAIERICLKALAKRTGDRYATAQDLREDLRAFVDKSKLERTGETKTFQTGVVVPKGLRSFDEADSDFFMQLLPGLRDQAGIPDSIRFWQRGIGNSSDPFRVGVLYGPSGSGKSSFLKAGLVPLLPEHVEVIYIAAVAGNTENILAKRLRDRFPEFDADEPLSECVRRIRTERDLVGSKKLLIVIDQFEQWLHANGRAPESELVAALRQCDGKSIQVLLTLRDDFWMAIGQLMEDIDVDLLQSQNAAAIDLFDRPHAWRVLVEFGRAYGRIPAGEGELSEEQSEFVRAALTDMEQDGKIIPLHLSLFAEMAKSLNWTRESYEEFGGTTAIGVEFLNSVFSGRTANPAHRAVEKPARAILEALLPSGESQIRGRPLAKLNLMEKAGLSENSTKSETIFRILDDELKLITPVDTSNESKEDPGENQQYQLTHDYLVPSLRGWLFESHRSTMQGRAFLRLNELSGAWRGSRDKRHLPSFWEWLRIRLLVPRNRFNEHDRSFIRTADLKNGRRIGAFLAILGIAGCGLVYFSFYSSVDRAVDRIVHADITELPRLLENQTLTRNAGQERMRQLIDSGQLDENKRLNVSLALLKSDPAMGEYLYSRIETLAVGSHAVVCDALADHGNELKAAAWRRVDEPDALGFEKLRQFAFLAGVDPENEMWREKGASAVSSLLSAPDAEIAAWSRQLKVIREFIEPVLVEESEARRTDRLASRKLAIARAEFADGDLKELLDLLITVQDSDLKIVVAKIEGISNEAIPALRKQAGQKLPLGSSEESRENAGANKARAGTALMSLGDRDSVWPLFSGGSDPVCRTFLIHLLPEMKIDPIPIFQFLAEGDHSSDTRIGLIQCLGGFAIEDFPANTRRSVADWVRKTYLNDPDPGIHSSARWVLGRWSIEEPDLAGESGESDEDRDWFALRSGHQFAVIEVPESERGNRITAPRFAIGMTEVTESQFLSFSDDVDPGKKRGNDSAMPVQGGSMNLAMRFCNWLSDQEGITRDQWCYEEKENGGGKSIGPHPDFLSRSGYRLPTIDEWTIAARAGSATNRYSGSGWSMISEYGWHSVNATDGKPSPVALLKPNDLGLFDVLGNVMEWCHPGADSGSGIAAGKSVSSSASKLTVIDNHRILKSQGNTTLGIRLAKTCPANRSAD